MERFTHFPTDIQSEILHYTPYYRRVKKNLNEQLFYDRYCHKPITVNEFLSYLQDENPSQFILFTSHIDYFPKFTLYHFNKGYITTRTLYIYEEDVDTYAVSMTYANSRLPITDLLYEIDNEIDYDLKTTYNIFNRRNCEKISPGYAKKMTLNLFNEHIKGVSNTQKDINLYSYFDLCKTLIYYSNNYDLLAISDGPLAANQLPRIALHRSGIEEILFNSLGEMIEGDEELIENMIEEYDFKESIINMIMNL